MDQSQTTPAERLQKVIARSGFASRRVADDLIANGRVEVDGVVAVLGQRVVPDVVEIRIDGTPLPVRPGLVYYLINKPAGMVTTTADTHGRATVLDIVPAEPRVVPVGRLDLDSTGLLILTNDGDLTQYLTHPSFGVTKTYVALVAGSLGTNQMRELTAGVELDDGRAVALSARVLQRFKGTTQIEIVMGEGRKREVRRMIEEVGSSVTALHRVAIGNLTDSALKAGVWRSLSLQEVRGLWEAGIGKSETTAKIEP